MSLNGDAVVPFMFTRIMSGNLSYVLHNTSVATVMMSESWKGQKLLSRAEFHVGARVTKFLRLQMLSTIGSISPLDELTFRRLQSLQKKLVDAVPHFAGLNPRSFHQFRSSRKAYRPGPDSIVDCELLCHLRKLENVSIGGTALYCSPDWNDPFPNSL
ncbi:Cleavage/polyadenylation specificity factor [Theobroma cacao]|nr:Cleavage/polyadenylation specificity factor [Theobroma cacao]